MEDKMNKQIKLALIGAGNRGQGIFGKYALEMPHRAKFTAVVEPDREKRELFAANHNIPAERVFADYDEFFKADFKDIEGVVIATLEDERAQPVLKSMEKGYHILVEKPLCTNAAELIKLYDATKDYAGILIVCHQMRLTPLYRTIKSLIDSGKYGDIVCIQHSENLSYSHMAHSFVRGFFNSSRLTPMLLAKSCHDMDILAHLIRRKAKKVASFGSLKYVNKKHCPEGAPKFCLDGCKHYHACPYHVLKLYFEPDTDQAYLRQMGVIKDKDQLRELLKTNRFGRCVFQTDNDVVDNQTVQIEFEDDIHVSFTMCGHNGTERRMTKISMTNGEIIYDGLSNQIKVHSFEPLLEETIKVNTGGTHGGGDRAIMDNFIDAIESGDKSILLTPIKDSLEGHLMVFAAEESRTSGAVVGVRAYEDKIRGSL
jgi:predicted dehydrogenase